MDVLAQSFAGFDKYLVSFAVRESRVAHAHSGTDLKEDSRGISWSLRVQ